MSEQTMNERLAAWLSKRTSKRYEAHGDFALTYYPKDLCSRQLWPFHKSLDAMALVQDAMTDEERDAFASVLAGDGRDVLCVAFATAAQRAEAACQVLGLGGKEGDES
jgi:hypothetical protein